MAAKKIPQNKLCVAHKRNTRHQKAWNQGYIDVFRLVTFQQFLSKKLSSSFFGTPCIYLHLSDLEYWLVQLEGHSIQSIYLSIYQSIHLFSYLFICLSEYSEYWLVQLEGHTAYNQGLHAICMQIRCNAVKALLQGLDLFPIIKQRKTVHKINDNQKDRNRQNDKQRDREKK